MRTGKYFIEFAEEEDTFSMVEDVFADDFTNLLTTTNPRPPPKFHPFPGLLTHFEASMCFEDFNKYDERVFATLWRLEHPEIRELSLAGFYRMARLELAVYNVEARKGSIFQIYNVPACKYLGVISVGSSRKDSVKALTEIFSFIIQVAGPSPAPVTTFREPPTEQFNLTDAMTRVRTISIQLDKLEKQGKWGIRC